MSNSIIPLQAVPSQIVAINLSNQACTINIYQKRTGLFVDLYVAGQPIVVGVAARYANKIVRDAYFGFIGDLAFFDLVDTSDPTYDGLGSRYFLAYLN